MSRNSGMKQSLNRCPSEELGLAPCGCSRQQAITRGTGLNGIDCPSFWWQTAVRYSHSLGNKPIDVEGLNSWPNRFTDDNGQRQLGLSCATARFFWRQ